MRSERTPDVKRTAVNGLESDPAPCADQRGHRLDRTSAFSPQESKRVVASVAGQRQNYEDPYELLP